MGTRINENNDAFLKGIIDGKFEYSHDVFGEKFYTTNIKVERESGSVDTIPIMVSERLVDISEDLTDVCVKISGSFRSYNKNIGENRLEIIDGASLYRTDSGKEMCVGYIRFCDYKLEYAVLPGQETEWVFDVEKLFGKLPEGEYRMTFGGFDYEMGYNGNWWKEIKFVI